MFFLKKLLFLFFFFFISIFNLFGIDKKILKIISKTNIQKNVDIKGIVILGKEKLNFSGFFYSIKKEKIIIHWNKINQSTLNPSFKSSFITQAKFLKSNDKLFIYGNFKKLQEKMSELKSDKNGFKNGIVSNSSSDVNFPNSKNSSNNNYSSKASYPNSSSSSSPSSYSNSLSKGESSTRVSNISYESCTDTQNASKIYKRRKKVTTFSNGKKEYFDCEVEKEFNIVSSDQGCSIRHDFNQQKSFLQKKRYYIDDNGSQISLSSCQDSNISFSHLKMSENCEKTFDKKTLQSYQQKKIYYKDASGNIQFITGCLIDASDIQKYSKDDFKTEYSQQDRVDYSNKVAFRRMRYYIENSNQKHFVSDWQDDIKNPMSIIRSYEGCEFKHDFLDQKSYRQYSEVYYRLGIKKNVTPCKKDGNKFFKHITSDKFCTPKVLNSRVVTVESTFFEDETGKVQTVKDCHQTNQDRAIDPTEIIRDYSQCKAELDLPNLIAVSKYVEVVNIGQLTKTISGCIKDENLVYPINETSEGCVDRVDFSSGKAILRKRKFYTDGKKNNYVSDCFDSKIEFKFEKSSDQCKQKLNFEKTNIIEYAETYYIDINGTRKSVKPCTATKNSTEITEDMKIKDYEVCNVLYDIKQDRVYKRYQTYLHLDSKKEILQPCQIDFNLYYEIHKDFRECNYKVDLEHKEAIRMASLYYKNGTEDIYFTSCIETDETFNISENFDSCPVIPVETTKEVIHQKKYYFTSPLNEVIDVSDCFPTPDRSLVREVSCDEKYFHDFTTNQTFFKTKYVYTNQQSREVIVKGCALSLNFDSMPHKYENCGWEHNDASLSSKLKTKKYFIDPTNPSEKIYIEPDCKASVLMSNFNYTFSSNHNKFLYIKKDDGGIYTKCYYKYYQPQQIYTRADNTKYYVNNGKQIVVKGDCWDTGSP